MIKTATIHRERLDDQRRVSHTANLFGIDFPMRLEPFIFNMAGNLSLDYQGGLWHFYSISNGAFYMAPESPPVMQVSCQNGFAGVMCADALGLTSCLYAYSHLSFLDIDKFSETCATQYHLLLEYVHEHAESRAILRAID